jgi:hypothetical protein
MVSNWKKCEVMKHKYCVLLTGHRHPKTYEEQSDDQDRGSFVHAR